MHLQWLLPPGLWLLLLAAAIGCVLWARRAYAGSDPLPPPGARRLLIGLRAAACVLILLAVARPLLIREQTVREPALVAVVVEDSGSMALRDDPAGPDRWTSSWRLAAAVDSLVARQAGGAQVVHLRGNGRLPLRETTLAAAAADTPRAVGTDLTGLIAQARQSLLGRPLRGLVILTDGNSPQQSPQTAAPGLPLWLVGIGDVAGPPDRFLADLRHPDRVQRGQPVTVEVAVTQEDTTAAARAEPITVRLLRDGQVVDERTGPAGDLTRWELTWIPQEPGLAVLDVEVSPLVNERFLANNRATLAVDVQKDRARILVLAPAPGWDVRFLAQAAGREPRLGLAVVRPGPAGPVLAATGEAWRAPATAEAWREDWDAVVLTGPPDAWLSDGGVALAAAVRQGLGLLALAGDPAGDERARAWPAALRAVLPVVLMGDQTRPGEFALRATGAARHPILAGIAEATGVLGSWPPLRRVLVVRPQPQAEVLLDAGGELPILVAGAADKGRSLWFGGRRLWELAFWRLPGTAAAAAAEGGGRLLQQMLLWTALGDQATGIALLGQRLMYEEGEHVPVATRWLDLRGDPVSGRSLAVEVARPEGGEARVHPLREDPARPGISSADLPPLPPGRWRLTPRNTELPAESGQAVDIVITRAERELGEVRQDRRNLRLTAARLGGAALDAGRQDHRERLLAEVAALDLQPRQGLRQARREPAAGWVWLGIAVGLLGAEWLLRRRHGLL